MIAAAAGIAIVVVGVGAMTMRGGSRPEANASQSVNAIDNYGPPPTTPATAAATTDEGTASNDASASNMAQNAPAAAATLPGEQSNSAQALAAERAKTAAAEAQLAALKKAQTKASTTQLAAATPSLPKKNGKSTSSEITSTPDVGVSPATLSQFNSTIDDARSMAKQVMRSGQGQNVQLARNYDAYLKTLKDSMRGIQSEKEAQKLLKQANQTRAYIVFLQRQQ
jgi:hypothetical protein